MKKNTIAILGAGSWGSAIAIHLAKTGFGVFLWAHNKAHVEAMQKEGKNTRFLPDIAFPPNLIPTHALEDCLQKSTQVILAVPSHAFIEVLNRIETPLKGLAWLTKGLDFQSHQLLSELVIARFGKRFPIAVIAGPSFATELAHGLPTALTIASNNKSYQKGLQTILHHNNLRVYLSNDWKGVQICGAVKNVLAIACGISDGLGFGANAKAALITRGLAEMSRLGLSLGAKGATFMGLAGVGDLVLTCTDNQSRNRRFGLNLGHGLSTIDAEASIGQVVEGKYNAAQVCLLAKAHHIEMPICQAVYDLLEGRISPKEAVSHLMKRPSRDES